MERFERFRPHKSGKRIDLATFVGSMDQMWSTMVGRYGLDAIDQAECLDQLQAWAAQRLAALGTLTRTSQGIVLTSEAPLTGQQDQVDYGPEEVE